MSLRTCCDWPALGRTVLVSTLIAACFPVIYFTYTGHLTVASAIREFLIPCTFANCVAIPATFIPWRWLGKRYTRAATRWAANIGILLILGFVGTALSTAVFVMSGMLPVRVAGHFYLIALPIVIVITVLAGTARIVYDSMRFQLQETTLQLRTQELERERILKLATEARLSSLESRLHPHFLFNTLNSISSLIPEDPKRAEKLVEQMAALLRFSLDSARHGLVPLERELKIANDYLEIEKTRLGERLTYDMSWPADLGSLSVPPLAIQTLVENTIKHVIAPSRAGGWLQVSVERSNGSVSLGVRDSGPGFDLQQTPTGHGLDNLRSRLTALYGNAASIGAMRENGAASVRVTIPVSTS